MGLGFGQRREVDPRIRGHLKTEGPDFESIFDGSARIRFFVVYESVAVSSR